MSEKLAKEAQLRGLYWTGGPWCDWVRQQDQHIAELKAVLEKLRLEASSASLFYPTDLALMQEAINSVLPTPPKEG